MKKQSNHDFIFYVKQLHVSAIHSYNQAEHKSLLTYLPTYLPTYLFTYLLTYLLTHSLTHTLTHSLTHSLTPYSTVLLEKLTGLELVKNVTAFYGTRKFITSFTSARHLSLSWASSIQALPPHPTCWRSILILSFLLPLGLPSGLFPSGFSTKPRTHNTFPPLVLQNNNVLYQSTR
jgi:hypothetical protein